MDPTRDRDPEILLREAAHVHRLARAIVRDAQAAEDVAQDTLLVALRRPPHGAADPHRLRAWLAKVVRSLALRSWRAEATRQRHEGDAARPEAGDRESRTLARLQQNRELLEAVAALPEPYRTAVTMRFLDGAPPRAIARELRIEPAAVRQRVHRGLAMLRARLERTHGDARFAVSALVPWSGWVPWVLPGVSIMMLKKVLAGAAAVAVVAALSIPFAARPEAFDPLATPAPGGVVPAAAAAPAAAVPTERQPAEVAAASERGPAGTATASTATLVVRVSAGAGKPLAHAPVTVWNRRRSRNNEPETWHGTTDRGGEARFQALAPGTWWIAADGRTQPKTEGNQVELCAGEVVVREIDVQGGFTLSGVVVDAHGNAVPGARVVVEGGLRKSVLAVTGANGEFHIANLLSPAAVQARAPGRQPGEEMNVTGEAGASVRVELRIGAEARRIEGRVLDAAGKPCASAVVALVPWSAREQRRWDRPRKIEWERTDGSGSFRSDEVGACAYVVVAQPREPELPPCQAEVDTTGADAFVELHGQAEGRIRGSITRGQDTAAATVIAWPDATTERGVAVLEDLGWRQAHCDQTQFEVRGLGAGRHRVRVIEEGAVVHEGVVDVEPGTVVEWNMTLPPLGELGVVVRGVAAKELMAMVRPAGQPAEQLAGLVALTGGEGRWKGSRPAASDVYLLFLDNKSDMVQLACRRGVLAHEQKVELEVSTKQLPHHWFEGRLVDERLQPLAGRRVEVHRVDQNGLIVRRGLSTSADGTFRIGPLPPGDYELRDVARPPRVLTRRFVDGTQSGGDVIVRAGG